MNDEKQNFENKILRKKNKNEKLVFWKFWNFGFLKKKCFGAKMDQMCPNWPKNEVFVSFLKFKPSDSADFAYSSSFLLSWTTIATKLAEKNF